MFTLCYGVGVGAGVMRISSRSLRIKRHENAWTVWDWRLWLLRWCGWCAFGLRGVVCWIVVCCKWHQDGVVCRVCACNTVVGPQAWGAGCQAWAGGITKVATRNCDHYQSPCSPSLPAHTRSCAENPARPHSQSCCGNAPATRCCFRWGPMGFLHSPSRLPKSCG